MPQSGTRVTGGGHQATALQPMENKKYTSSIAALPPLASGRLDAPAPAIEANTPLDIQDVIAARNQHKTRKSLASLDKTWATDEEVVASKRRKRIVESAHFDGPIPAWALTMQQQMEQMQGQMKQLSRRIDQERALSINRSRRRNKDPIEQVPRLNGDDLQMYPRQLNYWFPDDQIVIYDATESQINDLLGFYGLGTDGTFEQKIDRLKRHLGIIL